MDCDVRRIFRNGLRGPKTTIAQFTTTDRHRLQRFHDNRYVWLNVPSTESTVSIPGAAGAPVLDILRRVVI
jgi:hypothetical protein